MAVQSKEADASNNGTFASPWESQQVTHNWPTDEQQTEFADKLDESDKTEGNKPSKWRIPWHQSRAPNKLLTAATQRSPPSQPAPTATAASPSGTSPTAPPSP